MKDKIRILYIDDYDLDRELVKDVLEREHGGFEVIEASHRQEFEMLLKSRVIDVVLSDFNIAGFEGFQVLDAVREHDPGIPVIIVTGTGSEEIAAMAMKRGASDYVIKRPRHILKLPQTIFAAIDKKVLREKRHKAEVALKESEKRYREILENTLVGIYQAASDGKIKFANRKMIEMLGYSSFKELESIDSIAELYARPGEWHNVVDEIIFKGFVIDEFEFKCKDGQSMWVRLHSRKVTNKEEGIVFEGLLEDISKIRKMETQLQMAQRLESIGTLAGGIAHDFNNILSSIIGFTELSLDDVQQGTHLYDNLTEVLMAGKRARDLVKQIMTFSRKDEQEKKPIEINSLIAEAVKMFRSVIPVNIEIKEHIGEHLLIIHANASQINQILVNLVTNALHAINDEGTIEIGLDGVNFDDSIRNQYPDFLPGRYAKLLVSDNGCGIAQENLNMIFDPYFTTKEADKGTGLGLAVVHGIVKIHKGHITVYSEVGRGTTFHVYLPLCSQASEDESDRQFEQVSGGTERILFVDDEPSIVKMQKQNLERMGYTVTTQTSSVEALEEFGSSPDSFDLMITDMTMPQMTGDRLAVSIKKIRPDIPVILCTGFSEKINQKTAPDLLIDEFLMKPVDTTKMAKAIRKVLDGAHRSTQQ